MGLDDRINTRIDSDTKEAAVKVFQQLGITEGEAIRMFYTQVILCQGLPFPVSIPNQETIEAMKEGEQPAALPTYKRFFSLRKEAGI